MNYEGELARLYELQVDIKPDTYLHAHSRNRALIRRQISIFERCQPFLNDAQTVLDWGCRHAADACLRRSAFFFLGYAFLAQALALSIFYNLILDLPYLFQLVWFSYFLRPARAPTGDLPLTLTVS